MSRTITSKSQQKIFYCYALCDSTKSGDYSYSARTRLSHEPFYIGYGHGNRTTYHVSHAQKKIDGKFVDNSMKAHKIRKIISNGGTVLIVRTPNLGDQKTAQTREIELIRLIGRRDLGKGPLTNLTNGGEGTSGIIPTKSSIQKRIVGRKKIL